MEVFNWQEYLDSCKATDVPYTLFKHVEQSLDTGLKCGMAVEVPHKLSDTFYWPAIITKICGPMITLKYIGSEENDKSSEIWSEINSLHFVGFAESQGYELKPPSCLNSLSSCESYENTLQKLMKNIPTVPKCVLDEGGKNAVDRITSGMVVGVRNALDPYKIEDAEIILQAGGRLFLKYTNHPESLEWLFYTNYRVVTAVDCNNYIQFPQDLIKNHHNIEEHSFEEGMLLEMLNPKTCSTLHNGIISRVLDKHFFIVSIVNEDGEFDKECTKINSWLCTKDHPYIFPHGWSSENSLELIYSNEVGIKKCTNKEMFSLKPCAMSLGFQTGMKLEAVHPQNQHSICVATIKSIHEHLLCLTFDHEVHNDTLKEYYVYCNSDQIFPIYWCGTNNYELVHPSIGSNESTISNDANVCPIIYFNYKCRTGPMHSHKKIAQLPKSVGPGEVSQVLKKVLNLIVSEAYQPLRILRLLECEDSPGVGKTLVELKATNYNSSKEKITTRANVEVVTQASQVADYCREVCKTIQACPYLFGPHDVGDSCPENCAGDKNGNANDKTNKSKPVKYKRKRRKGLHFKTIQALARKAANQSDPNNDSDSDSAHTSEPISRPTTPASIVSNENDNTELSGQIEQTNDETKQIGKRRRKRKHNLSSSSPKVYEMKTRGAKLPNFALQIKQGHWDKKDVETLYKKTYSSSLPKKKPRYEYITESDSDTSGSVENDNNSRSDISNTNLKKEEISEIEEICETEEELSQKSADADKNMNVEQQNSKSEENLSRNSIEMDDLVFYESSCIKQEQQSVLKPYRRPSLSYHDNNNLCIDSNPLHWSVDRLHEFLMQTDCKDLADLLREEHVDGQAFMMLNLPFVRKYFKLKLDVATRLCEEIVRVKLVFFQEYGK